MPDINTEPGSFRERSKGIWGTLGTGVQQLPAKIFLVFTSTTAVLFETASMNCGAPLGEEGKKKKNQTPTQKRKKIAIPLKLSIISKKNYRHQNKLPLRS